MCRRERIYNQLRRGITLILVAFIYVFSLSMIGYADNSLNTENGYSVDRYGGLTDINTTSKPNTSTINSKSEDITDPVKNREEIEVQSFNNDFIDTAIYIIGGLAGMMMILQIAAFCVTRVYPSTNRFIEKLKFIGIDGYDRGFVVPTLKILLLGVLSFFCVSGLLKQAVAYILGWFVITFG